MKVQTDEELFRDKQAEISDQVEESGNDPLYLDGFEGGLIGWQRDADGYVHAVYSEELMLEYYCKINECPYEDAAEWYEFNTIRALPYCDQRNVPIIIHTCS